jgi:hypothetical protein
LFVGGATIIPVIPGAEKVIPVVNARPLPAIVAEIVDPAVPRDGMIADTAFAPLTLLKTCVLAPVALSSYIIAEPSGATTPISSPLLLYI